MPHGIKLFHIGNKKGRLTIMAAIPPRQRGAAARMWAFCDCGGEKLISHRVWVAGVDMHCGCDPSPAKWSALRTHGRTKTPEYRVWASMWRRCTNPKVAGYELYGGRGISVDPRWRDFALFFQDLGARPSPDHSIDRVNVNGPYAPGNVRWALAHEQAVNKRNTRMLTAHGKTLPLAVWARYLKVSPGCIIQRLKKSTPEQALVPLGAYKRPYQLKRPHKSKMLTYKGLTLNYTEWGKKLGISAANIGRRIRRGYTTAQALSVVPYRQFWRKRAGAKMKK